MCPAHVPRIGLALRGRLERFCPAPVLIGCWWERIRRALLLVFFVSVLTGRGRATMNRWAWQVEQKVLEDHAGAEPGTLWTLTSTG